MAFPYYNYSGAFIPGTLARAETVGVEFTSVQTGFALLSNQGNDTGALNALVVNTPYAPTALTDGAPVWFKVAFSSTGACTINVNATGVRNLVSATGAALQSGVLNAGFWYQAVWSAAQNAWILTSPSTVLTSGTITISGAVPTHKVGLVAAGGLSVAAMPIDATLALDQSIAPTWTGVHTFNAGATITTGSGVALTINPLAGQLGLSITGSANSYLVRLLGSATTGQSYGLLISAGTNSVDTALTVANQAAAVTFLAIFGDGHGWLGASSSLNLSWATTGAFVVAAPTSGTALIVNGASAGVSAQFTDGTTDFRVSHSGGNTHIGTSLSATSLNLATNGTDRVVVAGVGTVVINAPTSGISFTANVTSGVVANFASTGASTQVELAITAAGNTAGTTSFSLIQDNTSIGYVWQRANAAVLIGTNATTRINVGNTGAVVISAPTSSTNTLTVNGAANQYTTVINASSTASQSFGLLLSAGSNSSDTSILVRNQAASATFLTISGDGHGGLGTNSTSNFLTWSLNGNLTLAAPVSGTAFTLSAVSGAIGISLTSSSGAAGIQIGNGVGVLLNSTVLPALIMNSSGSNYGQVQNDGSNLWSLATGNSSIANGTKCLQWDSLTEVGIATPSSVGNLGAGMTQVGYMDTPQNSITANYTLALTDRGKSIYINGTTAAQTLTIPANGSIAFPVATTIIIVNRSNQNWSVAITTDTLKWMPSNTAGTRTLAPGGVATLYKEVSNTWLMWGFNIT